MKTISNPQDINLITDIAMDEEANADEFDSFVDRNHEALNAALAIAYEDVRHGRCRALTVADIMAMGEQRLQTIQFS